MAGKLMESQLLCRNNPKHIGTWLKIRGKFVNRWSSAKTCQLYIDGHSYEEMQSCDSGESPQRMQPPSLRQGRCSPYAKARRCPLSLGQRRNCGPHGGTRGRCGLRLGIADVPGHTRTSPPHQETPGAQRVSLHQEEGGRESAVCRAGCLHSVSLTQWHNVWYKTKSKLGEEFSWSI